MTDLDNFRNWFAAQIRRLAPDRDAGFIIAMVTFPLLERYLRQLTKSEPKTPRFITGLLHVLPELKTPEAAQLFWTTYRHGLLHNVTLSRETHGLTLEGLIVEVQSNGKVWLNPVLFSERVLARIEADFGTFEGGHPLPAVSIHSPNPDRTGAPNYYLGTSAPPQSRR